MKYSSNLYNFYFRTLCLTLTAWSTDLEKQTVLPLVKDIFYVLWKLKFCHCLHNSLPFVPILNLINPVQALTSYFLKICFKIMFPYIPVSSKWPCSFRFPLSNPMYVVPFFPYVPQCPDHLIILDLTTQIIFGGGTNHEASHYVIFSGILIFLPS